MAFLFMRRFGEPTCLDDDITEARQGVNAIADDDPDGPSRMNELGRLLGVRYSVRCLHDKQNTADLEESIQLARRAANATTNRQGHSSCLQILAYRLGKKHSMTNSMPELQEGIQICTQAVEIAAEDDPARAACLKTLGDLINRRYDASRTIDDLNESIKLTWQAMKGMEAAQYDEDARTNVLDVLANRLAERYLRLQVIEDLNGAILLSREAVKRTKFDDIHRGRVFDTLGHLLYQRYLRLGAMVDLDEAICHAREAVGDTSFDDLERPKFLGNLSCAIGTSYFRTRDMSELDESIQMSREAIRRAPDDHPLRGSWLANLGHQLAMKYLRTKDMAHHVESIQMARDAVEATAEKHPDRASRLINLSLKLSEHWEDGSIPLLDEAVKLAREAVDAFPPWDINRIEAVRFLGDHLMKRALRTGSTADGNEAIRCFQATLLADEAPISLRIGAGKTIITLLGSVSNLEEAFKAAQRVVPLVPKLMSQALESHDKQYALSHLAGLASEAAAAALRADKGPLVALGFLETARGVIGASLEMMRANPRDFVIDNDILVDALVDGRDRMNELIHRNTRPIQGENQNTAMLSLSDQRFQRAKELEELMEQIGSWSGSIPSDAISNSDMLAAAACGPVVILNLSNFCCDALLVERHQVRVLPLPGVTWSDIEEKTRHGNLGRPEILEWLWNTITGPVLDLLGFVGPPSGDKWPHVWWIPTGLLTRFPLHASGLHSKRSHEAVLDRVMSSYSSSLRAIIHGRRYSQQRDKPHKALLVALEQTPGHAPLPFAAREIAELDSLCRAMLLNPVQPGRRKEHIKDHLADCTIFHFAGHGYTNSNDPLQSYLCLEDWRDDPLRVADLLDINLRERLPFLAYLSACGTGRIRDEKFFDENIHLINACQLAGFRHVIGTLWEVDDEMCVDMAKMTYQGMRDGGMTDESVCLGLHIAARKLRDNWVDAFRESTDTRLPRDAILVEEGGGKGDGGLLGWVPYVHFGV
ncbi:CHAT domain-containing protein [Ilyonectria destructans]|nr:CHAT domain-containing protein [Ilyonectria destructans]